MSRIFFSIVLILLIGGGYYGYCHFKAAEKQSAFSEKMVDLRQELIRLQKTISPDDVRQLVKKWATDSNLDLNLESVSPTIEPLNSSTSAKLPEVTRTALSIAAKMPNHQAPPWIVGFKANFVVKHGIVKVPFVVERYTYFEDARP